MAQELSGGGDQPATQAFVITPADSDFASTQGLPRALWIGGAGNLRVDMIEGPGDVLFSGIAAGTWMPIRVKRVWSTNTTATLIIGVF